jgi:hypothetical protein
MTPAGHVGSVIAASRTARAAVDPPTSPVRQPQRPLALHVRPPQQSQFLRQRPPCGRQHRSPTGRPSQTGLSSQMVLSTPLLQHSVELLQLLCKTVQVWQEPSWQS